MVREPAIVLNSSRHTFKFFECSTTLELASDILTVFNIYRPPTSSNYSQKPTVFLDEFASLPSFTATTPKEFVFVGDFNVHVDTPSVTPAILRDLRTSSLRTDPSTSGATPKLVTGGWSGFFAKSKFTSGPTIRDSITMSWPSLMISLLAISPGPRRNVISPGDWV